jgi:hypothetical protein
MMVQIVRRLRQNYGASCDQIAAALHWLTITGVECRKLAANMMEVPKS